MASLEGVSTTFVSIVFAGNTLPFASNFDAEGIGRKKGSPLPGSSYPEWYRVAAQKDIDTTENVAKVVKIFTDVLVGSPVFVRVKKIPQDDSRFKLLVDALKEKPFVRFLT